MSATAYDDAPARDACILIERTLLGAVLDKLNETTRELRATQALLAHPALTPTQKVVSYNALGLTGAAPGRPATERTTEFSETNRGLLAYRSGLSKDQAGTQLKAIAEAGLIRRQVYTVYVEDDKGRKLPRKHQRLAPPNGQAWAETWANPRQIKGIAPSSRMVAAKENAAKQRDEFNKLKTILAQCPACGSTDVELRCHFCGVITQVADIPEAPATSTRTVASHDECSSGNDADEAGSPLNVNYALLEKDVRTNRAQCTFRESETVAEADATPAAPAPDALDAATAVIASAVTDFPDHVVMKARASSSEAKYTTIHQPLTEALVRDHLTGRTTRGAGLCQPDVFRPGGRHARAIAFDSDTDLTPLTRGAARLARAGLRPLLVRNPSKASSGHLWLFFDEVVEATATLAAVRTIAPELAELKEMFPNPDASNGHRLRLPGGYYLPVGAPRVAVDVALGDASGRPSWVCGVTPEGLTVIASAVSRAAILQSIFVPPAQRIRIKQAAHSPQVKRRPVGPVMREGDDIFATFNVQNPVESLVDVNRENKFKAPWRDEDTASVQVYPDGHWHDFGPDGRHGVDGFDLWCALRGFWDTAANKPDRKAGIAALKTSGGVA